MMFVKNMTMSDGVINEKNQEEQRMRKLGESGRRAFKRERKRFLAIIMAGVMAGSVLSGGISVQAQTENKNYESDIDNVATDSDAHIAGKAKAKAKTKSGMAGQVIDLNKLPLKFATGKGYCFTVNAGNAGNYNNAILTGKFETSDNIQACNKGLVISGTTVNLTIRDVTIDMNTQDDGNPNDCYYSAIVLTNNATLNLTLEGNNTLLGATGGAGICVESGSTLNITSKSTGSLKAVGGSFYGGAAGIGARCTGRYKNNDGNVQGVGNIIIRGGTIEAIGGTYKWYGRIEESAAGIGGSGHSETGRIEIHGGTVTASGGVYSAGIGGGFCGWVESILITGGNVTGTGSTGGAGIGGGLYTGYDGNCSSGDISIIGGTVTANGNLGYGEIKYDVGTKTGSVSVTGGTVDVSGSINPATNINQDHIMHHYDLSITISDAKLKDGTKQAKVFIGQGNGAYIGTMSMDIADGKATGTLKAATTLHGNQEISVSIGGSTYEDKTVNLDKDKTVEWDPVFYGVTDIKLLESEWTIGSYNLDELYEVTPSYATKQNINWSIDGADPQNTVATIENGVLEILKHGEIRLKATIPGGTQEKDDYVKTFTITVKPKAKLTLTGMNGWVYGDVPNSPDYIIDDKEADAVIKYKMKGTDDSAYSSTVPTQAGEYTVKVSVPESEHYGEASAETDFVISRKMLTASGINGICEDQYFTGREIIPGRDAIIVRDGANELEADVDFVIDSYSDNIAITTDQAMARILIKGTGNYDGTRTIKFRIVNKDIDAEAVLSEYDWTSQPVTVSAPEGYKICRKKAGNYDYENDFTDSFVIKDDNGKGTVTRVEYYLKEISTGIISGEKQIAVKIDTTAPYFEGSGQETAGGITAGGKTWSRYTDNITFALRTKDADAGVKANDSLSGVDRYYYFIDNVEDVDDYSVLSKERLDEYVAAGGYFTELMAGTPNSAGEFLIPYDGCKVVYAYAVDKAGNRSGYICSDGIVLDSSAPLLTSLTWNSQRHDVVSVEMKISESGRAYCKMIKKSDNEIPQPDDLVENAEGVKSIALVADMAAGVSFTDLDCNSEYMLYYVIEDDLGNRSLVFEEEVKTIRKKVLQDGDITISGTYGTAFENCSIVGNIVSETGEQVSGIFVLSDMETDKLQQVYSCEDNGKLIGVEFYPENDDYVSGNAFNAKIKIKKKTINVQIMDASKVYGTENPELTYIIAEDELVGDDTSDALRIVLKTSVTSKTSVGTYKILGKCTSTNYEARFTGITSGSAGSSRDHGILTVEKAGSPKLSGDKKTYDYAKGAVNERINIADMLPDDKGVAAYDISISDGNNILKNCKIDSNGILVYSVKGFTDNSMIGKTAAIKVMVSMENYGDAEFEMQISLSGHNDPANDKPDVRDPDPEDKPDVRDPDPEDKPADDTKTQPDDKDNKSQDDADKKPMDTNKDYDGSDKRQNDTDKSQKSVKDSKVSDETEKDLKRDTSGTVTDTESSDMDNEGENNIESAQETMADDDQSMSETNSDRDNGVRGYILFGSIAFAIMLLVVGGLLFMVKKRRKE